MLYKEISIYSFVGDLYILYFEGADLQSAKIFIRGHSTLTTQKAIDSFPNINELYNGFQYVKDDAGVGLVYSGYRL